VGFNTSRAAGFITEFVRQLEASNKAAIKKAVPAPNVWNRPFAPLAWKNCTPAY
jgi:hypothetical protein